MSDDLLDKGLESRERARTGKPAAASAKGAPISMKALHEAARSVQLSRRRAKEYATAVNKHLDHWRQQREKALASLPAKVREEAIAAEERDEREKALAIYRDDRAKVLDRIKTTAASVKMTARLFRDPVAYLDTTTLGNGKRSVYDRQLEGAGSARLAHAMLRADATGDADLYAAAHAKYGSLSKAEKEAIASRIDVHAVATNLVGDDLYIVEACHSAIEYHAAEAEREDDLLNGRQRPGNDKIHIGALAHIAQRYGDTYLDLDKEPASSFAPATE
jgi:hypothetical protein